MNRFFLSMLALILFSPAFSQNSVQADPRVTDYFGTQKVTEWAKNSPDSIKYYNFFVNNSFELWTVENAALRSDAQNPVALSLPDNDLSLLLNNMSAFNILKANLTWQKDKTTWYRLDGTQYMLLLQPLNYLENKFKSGK